MNSICQPASLPIQSAIDYARRALDRCPTPMRSLFEDSRIQAVKRFPAITSLVPKVY